MLDRRGIGKRHRAGAAAKAAKEKKKDSVASGGGLSSPIELAGLIYYYAPNGPFYSDAGLTIQNTNNGSIQRWGDSSGNGRHANQTVGANKPTLSKNVVNGYNVVRFQEANNTYFSLPDLSAFNVAIERHIVVKFDSATPGTDRKTGCWHLGSAGQVAQYPFTNGFVFDDCGTTARKGGFNPTPHNLTQWKIVGSSSVTSPSTLFHSYINGTVIGGDTNNLVGMSNAPTLGGSDPSGTPRYMDGMVVTDMCWSRKLSDQERASLITLLTSWFNIT